MASPRQVPRRLSNHRIHILKNLAIAGGCLFVFVHVARSLADAGPTLAGPPFHLH